MPSKARIPSGLTTVAKDASSAASRHRSLRTARKDEKSSATNKGSDPPRNERSIQSKLRIAKKPATQPPQRRYAITTAASDDVKQTTMSAVRSLAPVRREMVAIT